MIQVPNATLTITEEDLNRILAGKGWPLSVKLEENLLILFYEGKNLPIPTSIQVFIREVALEGLTLAATVEKMTIYHTLPLPRSVLNLVMRRFPFISYVTPYLKVDVASLVPKGCALDQGQLSLSFQEATLRIEKLTLPPDLLV